MTRPLDQNEQRTLLRLARASIAERLRSDGSLDRELERIELTSALREPRGVFVTLKQPGGNGAETLRGCIGCMTSRQDLYRNVIDVARKSAFEDPRFPVLTQDELASLRIEISALTPMRSVIGPEQIEVGRHGVQLKKGAAGSVFLPQVAAERSWTVQTLLQQLALKAGLPENGWRGAELSVFEAQVFAESRPLAEPSGC